MILSMVRHALRFSGTPINTHLCCLNGTWNRNDQISFWFWLLILCVSIWVSNTGFQIFLFRSQWRMTVYTFSGFYLGFKHRFILFYLQYLTNTVFHTFWLQFCLRKLVINFYNFKFSLVSYFKYLFRLRLWFEKLLIHFFWFSIAFYRYRFYQYRFSNFFFFFDFDISSFQFLPVFNTDLKLVSSIGL
jgi:hypothetical protein